MASSAVIGGAGVSEVVETSGSEVSSGVGSLATGIVSTSV